LCRTIVIITIVAEVAQEVKVSIDTKVNQGWLILVYKVPSNPSTLRIGIWKRIKELGALLLQQSVYILPNRPELKESLDDLKAQILKVGGECKLLETASFEEEQQGKIIEEFRLLADQDYEQIIDDCHALMSELERKSKTGKLTFGELEETERRLQKLKDRFENAVDRDFFVSALQADVSKLMKLVDDFISVSHEVLCGEEGAPTEKRKAGNLEPVTDGRQSAKEETLVHSKDEMAKALNEVVDKLLNGTLKLEDHHVQMSNEPVSLTVDYRESRRGKSLRIGLDWRARGKILVYGFDGSGPD